jgi:hypothetical protein
MNNMNYFVPADPAIPLSSLSRLRAQAKRIGYCIGRDRYSNTFSLVDARLRVPLFGLDHVALAEIAHAIEEARVKN